MVQRLTYRKRHSYATKSNQHRIVKTPGNHLYANPTLDPFYVFSFDFLFVEFNAKGLVSSPVEFVLGFHGIVGFVCLIDLSLCVCVLCVENRREASLPDYQEEGKRTQVPCYWQENPGGM